jgi:dynein heavy chain, axonemal
LSAIESYIGAFVQQFRLELWSTTSYHDLLAKEIPMTEKVDPLSTLTIDGKNAKMMSQGLPSDRISIENGTQIVSVGH